MVEDSCDVRFYFTSDALLLNSQVDEMHFILSVVGCRWSVDWQKIFSSRKHERWKSRNRQFIFFVLSHFRGFVIGRCS
jgi:hypothetical protein